MSLHLSINRVQEQQRGFSLVEVLIALVIMSVGMLGIAGLYVQSLQAGRTSMLRHNAVTLAGDVADRIRANPLAGVAYQDSAGVDRNCVDDSGTACDASEMADHDVFLWKQQAGDTLPGGDVTITFDDTAFPNEYTINVNWTEPEGPLAYEIIIPVLGI